MDPTDPINPPIFTRIYEGKPIAQYWIQKISQFGAGKKHVDTDVNLKYIADGILPTRIEITGRASIHYITTQYTYFSNVNFLRNTATTGKTKHNQCNWKM